MSCFTYKKLGEITVVNDGLFYYGPNTGIFGFNIILIVLFTALAFGPGSPHAAVTVIGVLWGLLSLYFLLRCGLTDPGIIPRQEDPRLGATNWQDPNVQQPEHREVIVECKNPYTGKVVPKSMELTWCYTCHVQRPLRASHCKWCDCCVERMDHHCPWTGTCIGARNYRYFFGFVNCVALYCLFIIATMCWSMKKALDYGRDEKGLSGTDAFFEGMKSKFYYMPIICAVVAIVSLAMVGGLACYHCNLTAGDLTTHEDLRRYYWMLNSPFDRGSCSRNCGGVLCSDLAPSVMTRVATSHQAQGQHPSAETNNFNLAAVANALTVDDSQQQQRPRQQQPQHPFHSPPFASPDAAAASRTNRSDEGELVAIHTPPVRS